MRSAMLQSMLGFLVPLCVSTGCGGTVEAGRSSAGDTLAAAQSDATTDAQVAAQPEAAPTVPDASQDGACGPGFCTCDMQSKAAAETVCRQSAPQQCLVCPQRVDTLGNVVLWAAIHALRAGECVYCPTPQVTAAEDASADSFSATDSASASD